MILLFTDPLILFMSSSVRAARRWNEGSSPPNVRGNLKRFTCEHTRSTVKIQRQKQSLVEPVLKQSCASVPKTLGKKKQFSPSSHSADRYAFSKSGTSHFVVEEKRERVVFFYCL